MRMTAGLTRCTKPFALAVALLFAAGMAFAQNDYAATQPPLSIQPGTFLTVRTNEAISSDRNQVGDAFSTTLAQPVIVQGIVVAQRGQTVAGRVVDTRRAGMVSGTSSLGIALTSLTLADGQTVPIQTQLLVRNGRPAVQREAATIVGTTGAGAVIGAIAGRGRGAAIGAGVGAAVGTLGVLLTRGYPTIVYPESLLTFEVMAPVPVDTSYAPQAFRNVSQEDYQQAEAQLQPPPVAAPVVVTPPPPQVVYPYAYPYPYYFYGPPYPYYYPYYARPYYYRRPYYYGPSVSFVFGGSRHYGYPAHYGYVRSRPAPYYRPVPHGPVRGHDYRGGGGHDARGGGGHGRR